MNVLRHCEREIVRALAATGSTQSQVTHADRFEIATDDVVLKAAGVDAVRVDLFPGRSDGYDLSDALLAAHEDGRADDLRRYLVRLEDGAWRAAA